MWNTILPCFQEYTKRFTSIWLRALNQPRPCPPPDWLESCTSGTISSLGEVNTGHGQCKKKAANIGLLMSSKYILFHHKWGENCSSQHTLPTNCNQHVFDYFSSRWIALNGAATSAEELVLWKWCFTAKYLCMDVHMKRKEESNIVMRFKAT